MVKLIACYNYQRKPFQVTRYVFDDALITNQFSNSDLEIVYGHDDIIEMMLSRIGAPSSAGQRDFEYRFEYYLGGFLDGID